VVAFAEMVMMALRKSPAEVWVEVDWSGARKEMSRGTRFCCCSHCTAVSYGRTRRGKSALLEADDLQQQIHNDWAVDVLQHVCDDVVE
jgi:hypothetical protein